MTETKMDAPNPSRAFPISPRLLMLLTLWTSLAGHGRNAWATPAGNIKVLTYHNDNARTGQNLSETILTLTNVNQNTFGKLATFPVDGDIFAQPLYLPAVPIPGHGLRNVVIIVTEQDGVYAFDADGIGGSDAGPLWHDSFINPAAGITAVPLGDLGLPYALSIGITGTPVVDPDNLTIYVVAKTKQTRASTATYRQHLHALDAATGAEKFGGPVLIQASVPGIGDDTDGQGYVPFDALYALQRCGLLALNGVVYIAFASAGDVGPYHGWVLGYDARTLALVQALNDTPNASAGGIWMSGGAPATDAAGSLYCLTGNGTFDADNGGVDFGNSILKLTPAGTNLIIADYFTPYNQDLLNSEDGDLGSGGALILPDETGSTEHPHLLLGGGKDGNIYLVDRDNLGHFNPVDNSQIVQSLEGALPWGLFGTAAYFNHCVYIHGNTDILKAYAITNGQLSLEPISQTGDLFGFPGATPSISANGDQNAIAWVIRADQFDVQGPEVLYAYNATNLVEALYNSSQNADRDQMGYTEKFPVPTIANGRCYAGSGSGLEVFGLLGPPTICTPPKSQIVSGQDTVLLNVVASGEFPLSYQWQRNNTNIIGATNVYLALDQRVGDQGGEYRVVVSNSLGTQTSPAAYVSFMNISLRPPFVALSIQGQSGTSYHIDCLNQLALATNWTTLTNFQVSTAPSLFVDLGSSNAPQRFYRVVMTSPLGTNTSP